MPNALETLLSTQLSKMGIESTALICPAPVFHKPDQGKELWYQMQSGCYTFTAPGLTAADPHRLLVTNMPQSPPEISAG